MNLLAVEKLILSFLEEDLGSFGDLSALPLTDKVVEGEVIVKEEALVCGLPFFEKTFKLLDPQVEFSWNVKEGEKVSERTVIGFLKGNATAILSAERTALNLLQRLSGIATTTREFVKILKGSPVKLLDTRKTTPGLRVFEKYATKIGGALNHRFGLYDGAMIKDNHIKVYGSVLKAVLSLKDLLPVTAKLEVEVETWEQLEEVLSVLDFVDIVMLDNWNLEEVERAVELLKSQKKSIKIEVSGGITKEDLEKIKYLPVDFVSTSKIITAAKWIDVSLEVL